MWFRRLFTRNGLVVFYKRLFTHIGSSRKEDKTLCRISTLYPPFIPSKPSTKGSSGKRLKVRSHKMNFHSTRYSFSTFTTALASLVPSFLLPLRLVHLFPLPSRLVPSFVLPSRLVPSFVLPSRLVSSILLPLRLLTPNRNPSAHTESCLSMCTH